MGMFDHIECEYPVAGKDEVKEWQTKDLECELSNYKIDEGGQLWYEDYDIEDQSDPEAEGFMALRGIMTRVNKSWIKVDDYSGEIIFYGDGADGKWYEHSAIFDNGKLINIKTIRDET